MGLFNWFFAEECVWKYLSTQSCYSRCFLACSHVPSETVQSLVEKQVVASRNVAGLLTVIGGFVLPTSPPARPRAKVKKRMYT